MESDDFLTENQPFELSPSEVDEKLEEYKNNTPPTNYKDDCPPSCAECGYRCLMEE